MCRVKFCGPELIFDSFLQNFLFIQRISTNNCPTNCITVPSVKGMVAFDLKYYFFVHIPLCDFSLSSFYSLIPLQIFHPMERIRTKTIFLDVK